MGVAIACGLGASYMTARLLAERQSDDEPKVDILVAKRALNMGDTIKNPEDMFQLKKVTKGEEPPGALGDFEALRNRILRTPRLAGDHITQEELFGDKDQRDFMAWMLPPNHRGVGIAVNMVSGAFGFACAPLSRVDVICTMRRADDRATQSRVVLENVLVLAADDKMRRTEDGKPMPSTVVTLALKPEDMLKVRLAGEMGTLSLALRKINDTGRIENPVLTAADLKNGGHSAGLVEGEPATELSSAKPPEPKPAVVATSKPAPKSDPKVDEVIEVKNLRQHQVAVSEGGKTRYFTYWFNENNERVDAPGAAQAPHEARPPRPDAVGSKK